MCKMFNGRNTSEKQKFNMLLFILVITENTLLDVMFVSIPLGYKNPDTCMGVSVIFLTRGNFPFLRLYYWELDTVKFLFYPNV